MTVDIVREVRALPLWAQAAGLFLTLVATIAALWAIYLVYNPPIPKTVFAEAVNATSTVPLMDILSRASDFRTDYERSNFLKPYEGKYVNLTGSYEDFFGESQHYVIISSGTNWITNWIRPYRIACELSNSEPTTKDALLLLQKGQTLYAAGTFSNGSLNGYYYPIVRDCELLTR